MLRRGIRGGWLAALIAAAASVVVAAADGPRFSLGILRRDGLLIPFASYNGKAWSTPWPGGAQNVALPIALSDVPRSWWGPLDPGTAWTAWLADAQTRPLTLGRPVHVPIFCGAHLAVSTDYRSASPADRQPTIPKDGLAIAGNARLEPVVEISLAAPVATGIVQTITEKFNEQEDLAASSFTSWHHPYDDSARARFPIELEAVYGSLDMTTRGAVQTTYVEAVRRFPALPRDEGCGLQTFVRGWITQVKGKRPIINLGARVTYCDRADASFMQPFGRIVLPGGGAPAQDVFWVFQLSSWRDEFYSVARVAHDGVKPVVAVGGGGCPKDPAR